MKVELNVLVDSQYLQTIGARIEVPELYRQCFEPMDKCDDNFVAGITGGATEEKARVIMKTREDAADVLGKELAELIIMEMKKHDTHNGY